MIKRIAMPLAVVFCSIGATTAAQEPTISVLVQAGGQKSPVEVVGLRRAGKEDHSPSVHFRNNSSQKTARIWVEAIISGRDGKVVRINSNAPNVVRPDERSIPSGGEGWAHEVVLQSSRLVTAGKELHSNCLQVTVLVLAVDFADGTSWNRDQGQKGISWTLPSRIGGADPCKDATASQVQVSQIAGAATHWSHPDKPSDRGEVDSYSFSCSLASRQGESGLVATCPF